MNGASTVVNRQQEETPIGAPKFEVRNRSGGRRLSLPLFATPVRAGFPSPAENFLERSVDLNEELIQNQVATFYYELQGTDWQSHGLFDGDRLVVDRSLGAKDGAFVIADVFGSRGLYVVRCRDGKGFTLVDSKGWDRLNDAESVVWGVVTYAIKPLGR